jgi:radical SAM superfamily enzyme YgiQ (UPF0313 family)
LGLTWSMMTRIDFMDEDLLAEVARAGCIQIDYGVESGYEETLKRVHKPHTVEMVKRIVPATAAVGIKPYVFFILGFPWDTPESIEATRRLMEELSPFVACFHPAIASILIPFPGTAIYEAYKGQYGFHDWWLDAKRSYDAPNGTVRPYFESELYARGAVLDADFFGYDPAVRRSIGEVFTFMWRHNLRRSSAGVRLVKRLLFEASRALWRISPSVERIAFAPVKKARFWAAH